MKKIGVLVAVIVGCCLTADANVFQATSHVVVALSTIVTCPAFQLYENTYEGDPFSIFWGLTQYMNLEKWTAETGMY